MRTIRIGPEPGTPEYEDWRVESEARFDDFFKWLGLCINYWAYVEETVFEIAESCLGTSKTNTAIVFARAGTLSNHIDLIDDLIKTNVSNPSLLGEWNSLRSDTKTLVQFRNLIAHQPYSPVPNTAIDITTGEGRMIDDGGYHAIQTARHEVLRGRVAKTAQIRDLQDHFEAVLALSHRYHELRTALQE